MLCRRHGEHLQTWASQAEASPVSELRSFANGLRKDWAAVTARLTLPYSSGAVEGHVNRIKMIKRQMYGRWTAQQAATSSWTSASKPTGSSS
jgi:transposase